MINREPIYTALYELFRPIKNFRTVSRRMKLWTELQPGQMPALFMVQGNAEAQQKGGLPTLWVLDVSLILYTYQADENASPMPAMNDLLDGVEAALAPDDPISNRLTLGGLVSHVWIEGTVEVYEGAIASHTVAIVPLRILAN